MTTARYSFGNLQTKTYNKIGNFLPHNQFYLSIKNTYKLVVTNTVGLVISAMIYSCSVDLNQIAPRGPANQGLCCLFVISSASFGDIVYKY